jgi:hypothetical protein
MGCACVIHGEAKLLFNGIPAIAYDNSRYHSQFVLATLQAIDSSHETPLTRS